MIHYCRVKRSCCCCGTSTCSQENTSGRKKASRCDARRSASVHRRRALPWIINRRTVPSPPLHVRKSAPEGVKGEQVRPSHHRPSPPPCRLFWPSQVGQNAALVADGAPLYRKSRPDSSISIDRKVNDLCLVVMINFGGDDIEYWFYASFSWMLLPYINNNILLLAKYFVYVIACYRMH